jgi:hypothetical protein
MKNPSEARGKEFERTVATLLQLAGYAVRREHVLGFKKVDLYFEETRLGSVWRTAVECKCYADAITQSELTGIYANYLPLYESHLIDQLLIVTECGLAPSAESMVRDSRVLAHTTAAELHWSVMDFRSYLSSIVQQYERDGLPRFYVRPRMPDGSDLELHVRSWLEKDPPARPLAILAGYGMGKTTFARHLACTLAREAMLSPTARIPILLRLGDISSEQSLEGLLGKAFTATHVVKNYRFDVFMALNGLGRFVLLLDGFDEMKHTLSWSEFRFNAQQLNRLVRDNPKALLFGRPTAFLTDDEHRSALHGTYVTRGLVLREHDWPDYTEYSLIPFSREQIREFLEGYVEHEIGRNESTTKTLLGIQRIIDDGTASSHRFADIASRPVQLKMLADILPQWTGDLDSLTVTILYSVFIDFIIQRELEKASRQRFDLSVRRKFAQQLAWWLWNQKQLNVGGSDIPAEIIDIYVQRGENREAVRRDLVAACFLEKKIGDALYFPHRSFQEFLVAEEICQRIAEGTMPLSSVPSVATDEVTTFMKGMITGDMLRSWEHQLSRYRGALPLRVLELWLCDHRVTDYLVSGIKVAELPWFPLLLALGIHTGAFPNALARTIKDQIIERIAHAVEPADQALGLFCILMLTPHLKGSWTQATTVGAALAQMTKPTSRRVSTTVSSGKAAIDTVVDTFTVEGDRRCVGIGGCYSVLYRILNKYCWVEEWGDEGTFAQLVPGLPLEIERSGLAQFSPLEALIRDRIG